MIAFRLFAYRLVFFAWNLGLGLTCFWILALPRPCMLRFVRFYLGGIQCITKYIAGTDYRVIGQENLPATPCIIAAKHLAPWETMALPLLGKSPAIVLKQELMRIPLWGWYAWKYGNVPVDRAAGSRAMIKMVAAARQVVRENRDILIFPQGTRLELGEWRPYKIGVASMYKALQIPILPVAINSGIFWSRNGRLRRTGTITVEILPVIPPGLAREQMMEQLQTVVETATNRLVAAEGGPAVSMPAAPAAGPDLPSGSPAA